jgi:HK97 family phage prohead protease
VKTRNAAVIPAAVQEFRDMTVVRSLLSRADAGVAEDGALGRMTVRFSRFGNWYEVNSWWEGRFLESIAKGAFRKTMRERGPKGSGQIVTLFDHGYDFYIGDKPLGRVDVLREDQDFAVLEADLFDTTYTRDLAPGLREGVYGSSFMFNVVRDEWNNEPDPSDSNPEGIPERTIREVRLFEAGPVTWPANPEATAELNSCRSDTDRLYERMARRDPTSVDGLRRRILDLRTSAATPAGDSTGRRREAADDANEPTPGHSPAAGRAQRARRIREAGRLASR